MMGKVNAYFRGYKMNRYKLFIFNSLCLLPKSPQGEKIIFQNAAAKLLNAKEIK